MLSAVYAARGVRDRRDSGQDLRFLRDAREIREPTTRRCAHVLVLSSCKVSRADVHRARRSRASLSCAGARAYNFVLPEVHTTTL